jgi:hypothetical protein
MRKLLRDFIKDETVTSRGMIFVAILIASALLARAVGAVPGVMIYRDTGGLISDYQNRYATIRSTGERVIIEGECTSACTIVLSLPRGQACAMPNAVLGFHAGSDLRRPGEVSAVATKILADIYPPNVRKWFYASAAHSLSIRYVRATRFLPKC